MQRLTCDEFIYFLLFQKDDSNTNGWIDDLVNSLMKNLKINLYLSVPKKINLAPCVSEKEFIMKDTSTRYR